MAVDKNLRSLITIRGPSESHWSAAQQRTILQEESAELSEPDKCYTRLKDANANANANANAKKMHMQIKIQI